MNFDSISPKRKAELSRLAVALHALSKGPIRNVGSLMCDVDMNFLKFRPSDMYEIIRDAFKFGITIERTDAGGTPTWVIAHLTNSTRKV